MTIVITFHKKRGVLLEIMHILTRKLIISSKYYQQILSLLKSEGGKARVIGGAVRDAILGKKNYDIDIATDLLPQETIDILAKSNIKVLPTGKKYGTVTAFFGREKFEITTLRQDIISDGRHAVVVFTDDFRLDAARRDFTINALSYCPFEQKVYDYFNGAQHLQQGKVVFIGQAYRRICEDFLRILRFFRFSSYYAKKLDNDGVEACIKLKENLKFLSKERIKSEMDKLIISSNSPSILQQMFEAGILTLIFPISQFDKKPLLEATFLASSFAPLPLYHRYSLLFYHITNLALSDLLNLKFSRKEAAQILSIIKLINIDQINENSLRTIWFEKQDYLHFLNLLVSLDKLDLIVAKKFIHDYANRARALFPITGHDLANIQSKAIGVLLRKLKKLWIESDFRLTKEQLLKILEK